MSYSLQCYIERKPKEAEDKPENWKLCFPEAVLGDTKHLFYENGKRDDYDFMTGTPDKLSIELQKKLKIDKETLDAQMKEGEHIYLPGIYIKGVNDIETKANEDRTKIFNEAITIAAAMGVESPIDADGEWVDYNFDDNKKPCTGTVVQGVIQDQLEHMTELVYLGEVFNLCRIANEFAYDYIDDHFKDYDVRFVFIGM